MQSIDNITLVIDNSHTLNDPATKKAFEEYWDIADVSSIEFRFMVPELEEQWGKATIQRIRQLRLMSSSNPNFRCPICESLVTVGSRAQFMELFSGRKNASILCNAPEHESRYSEKYLEARRLMFRATERPNHTASFSLLDIRRSDLLKLYTLFSTEGGVTGYVPTFKLSEITKSWLPSLVTNGYLTFFDEEMDITPEEKDAIAFLRASPNNIKSRFKDDLDDFDKVLDSVLMPHSEGYYINSYRPDTSLEDTLEILVESIYLKAYTPELIDKYQEQIIDARTIILSDMLDQITSLFDILVEDSVAKSLVLKQIALKLSVYSAADLLVHAAEVISFTLRRPGVNRFVQRRAYISYLNKTLEKMLAPDGEFPQEQYKIVLDYKCDLEPVLSKLFLSGEDPRDCSVEEIVTALAQSFPEEPLKI